MNGWNTADDELQWLFSQRSSQHAALLNRDFFASRLEQKGPNRARPVDQWNPRIYGHLNLQV